MQHPTVSVIVPILNGDKYLKTALLSIFNQTYAATEILVVDGGSIDRSREIACSFSQVTWLKQTGTGLANARNTGLQAATGELIAFLDHDDYWMHRKLEKQVEYLCQNPKVKYVISQLKFLLEDNCNPAAAYTEDSFKNVHIGCTPSALLSRRTLFEQFDFNETFRIGCDADWFARVRDAGIESSLISEVLTYKLIHNSNLSSNFTRNREELIQVVIQSLERRRRR